MTVPVIRTVGDVGQEEDFDAAREKALKVGANKFFLEVRFFSKSYNFSNQWTIAKPIDTK